MTPELHRRLIAISLGLYFVATWCSMAGMEIFGWLTFALTMSFAARRIPGAISFRDLAPFIPWKSLILLLVITILSVPIKAVHPEVVFDIGSLRWMWLLILSFMMYITLRLWKSLPRVAVWLRDIALGSLRAQFHLRIG